jgi:hypothetical protein
MGTRIPSCCARRDPAAPPNARVISSNDALSRHVRRAYRRVVFGNRSVNMCCPQPSVSQKNRCTRNSIRTGIPSQGRSLSRRKYRLCTRRDGRSHEGQKLAAPADRNTIINRLCPSTFSSSSITSPASGTNVPCPIGSTGDRQSSLNSCPNSISLGVSPNVRKNHFCSAAEHRSHGVLWSIFAPALIAQ